MKRCAAFGRNDCVLFLLQFYVFYVFTDLSANLTPFGVMIFDFCVFPSRSTSPTTSGGSIFRCTTKDRGERRAKGLRSRPLDSGFLYGGMRGDVRRSYEFAEMQLTRLSRRRRSAYSLASLYCALTGMRQHRRKKYPWGAPTAVKKLELTE